MYIYDMYAYIYIQVCMWTQYFYKYLQHIFSNFYIFYYGYFHTYALYIKFLNGFSLPDVSSSVIPVSHVVSVVFSVTVMVGDDTTSNKWEICIGRY